MFGTLTASELRARGHDVTLGSRRTGVNAHDVASVLAALRGSDGVVHTAGPFLHTEPGAARAAAELGVPYVDISDDRTFSAAVAAIEARSPLLTGMSTTPALADALLSIARRKGDPASHSACAMFVGGANEQGPATMAFAARSRAAGPSVVVDFPVVGKRRAFPAKAFVDARDFFVAVGGLGGLGWRSRTLLRALAPYAARFPRLGWDTAGALMAYVGDRREGLYALENGQRMAVLPAVWALEEALGGRAPRRGALPSEWVDAERLLGFLAANGFQRVSE